MTPPHCAASLEPARPLHRPWAGQDIGENGAVREIREQEHRLEPDVEDRRPEADQQEKYQQSLCAESLVVQRPRRRQDVFEDVRAVERWDWNQIERGQREVDQYAVEQHRL